MDNIMKRFKCFTTIMQNSSSSTDDDDKDEEAEALPEPDGEDNTTMIKTTKNDGSATEEVKIEVILPEVVACSSEFSDSGYWKMDASEHELDDLLADYEWAAILICFGTLADANPTNLYGWRLL